MPEKPEKPSLEQRTATVISLGQIVPMEAKRARLRICLAHRDDVENKKKTDEQCMLALRSLDDNRRFRFSLSDSGILVAEEGVDPIPVREKLLQVLNWAIAGIKQELSRQSS